MDEIKSSVVSNLLLAVGIFALTAFAFFLGRSTAHTESLMSMTGQAVIDIVSPNKSAIAKPDFGTYTKAVCYNTTKSQVCHDVLYAKCNGKDYPLQNLTKPVVIISSNVS